MSLSDLLLSILGPAPEAAIASPDGPLGENRLLINGHLVEARSGATFDNVDPTSELLLGAVCDAGVEDAREAISAARR